MRCTASLPHSDRLGQMKDGGQKTRMVILMDGLRCFSKDRWFTGCLHPLVCAMFGLVQTRLSSITSTLCWIVFVWVSRAAAPLGVASYTTYKQPYTSVAHHWCGQMSILTLWRPCKFSEAVETKEAMLLQQVDSVLLLLFCSWCWCWTLVRTDDGSVAAGCRLYCEWIPVQSAAWVSRIDRFKIYSAMRLPALPPGPTDDCFLKTAHPWSIHVWIAIILHLWSVYFMFFSFLLLIKSPIGPWEPDVYVLVLEVLLSWPALWFIVDSLLSKKNLELRVTCSEIWLFVFLQCVYLLWE